jgi:hypothetical protein
MPRKRTVYKIHQWNTEPWQEPYDWRFEFKYTKKSAERLALKWANETKTIYCYFTMEQHNKAYRRPKTLGHRCRLVDPQ